MSTVNLCNAWGACAVSTLGQPRKSLTEVQSGREFLLGQQGLTPVIGQNGWGQCTPGSQVGVKDQVETQERLNAIEGVVGDRPKEGGKR